MKTLRQLSIVMVAAAMATVAGGCAAGWDSTDVAGEVDTGSGASKSDQELPPTTVATPSSVSDQSVTSTDGVRGTTTTSPTGSEGSSTDAAAPPAPRPRASASGDDAAVALLDDAVSSSDLCQVYAALGRLTVVGGDSAALERTLDLVASTLQASDDFVPESLEESWSEMQHELDRARSELAQPDPDHDVVVRIFSEDRYATAHSDIEDWRDENCA